MSKYDFIKQGNLLFWHTADNLSLIHILHILTNELDFGYRYFFNDRTVNDKIAGHSKQRGQINRFERYVFTGRSCRS